MEELGLRGGVALEQAVQVDVGGGLARGADDGLERGLGVVEGRALGL